ncbi:MAG: hypothetical protein M3354_06495 [Chloroflexota bacterium]|nr:hypothetical protein [Chloroflexota bacterium]
MATKVRLGRVRLEGGRRDAARRAALRLDPGNVTLHRQSWAVAHPDTFDPTIDVAWQSRQLAIEREEEIAASACGPDGCPLPSASVGTGSANSEPVA